jgi:lipid-A-disaccharide synthase
MRIGIIAGEASGDLLAAGLIAAIKARHPEAEFEGIAGPAMIQAGCRAFHPAEKLAVMGFEALAHYRELKGIQDQMVRHFSANPPDLFIGVDAPDFNLTIERKLKEQGIKAVHYVSPSVWAWRQYRVKKIARSVDMILTLFPFEAEFYRQHQVPVTFVGHPLADMIPLQIDQAATRRALAIGADETVVALLPGSRLSEINRLAELLLHSAVLIEQQHPGVRFVAPMATPKVRERFEQIREQIYAEQGNRPPLTLVDGRAREVMAAADVVVLASGTATLEALLVKRPMVVTYKLSALGYLLVRLLLKSPYVSLPNVLAGREVVKELLQSAATAQNIAAEVMKLLQDPAGAARTRQLFDEIHQTLRRDANNSAAVAVLSLIDDVNQEISK